LKKYLLGVLFCGLAFSLYSQGGKEGFYLRFVPDGTNEIVADFHTKTGNNRYDSIFLLKEIDKLVSLLQMNGYIAASADSMTIMDSLAFVQIFAGDQYRWGEVETRGFDLSNREQKNFKRVFQQGKNIHTDEVLRTFEKVLQKYENKGYPFAMIEFEEVEFEDNFTNALISLHKYNKIFIDSIIIRGDVRINPLFIQRQSTISQRSIYSQKKIRNLDRTLNSLPYLTFVREPGVEFRSNGADLYLFIDRQRANLFQGLLGFMSDHRQSGKLVLNGDIQLGLMNSFGAGESLALKWKKTDLNNQELDLGVQWPFLFGTPVGVEGNFHLFRFDTLYMNMDFRLALRFYMGGSSWMNAFYKGKSSSAIGGITASNLNDFQSRMYGLGYEFSSLDNFYNPRRGLLLNSSLAFGKRSLPAENAEKEISNRFDIQVYASWYLPLAQQSALLFKNHTGSISLFEKGKAVYLLGNEMYRLGGMNNIRGFDENSILADSYTSFTMEYRWLFDRFSNIFAFTDFMYYRKELKEGLTEDTPFGFGIGLNLQTAAGMFSISYALGTQQGNPIEFRAAKVHLGYVSRF
jgi:outer membrane protein assembly factor BamA